VKLREKLACDRLALAVLDFAAQGVADPAEEALALGVTREAIHEANRHVRAAVHAAIRNVILASRARVDWLAR
jgi:hypothetical protein